MLRNSAKNPGFSNPPAKEARQGLPFAAPLVREVKLGFCSHFALSFDMSFKVLCFLFRLGVRMERCCQLCNAIRIHRVSAFRGLFGLFLIQDFFDLLQRGECRQILQSELFQKFVGGCKQERAPWTGVSSGDADHPFLD